MKRAILVDAIAILFMVLFLYTGISKLMDYATFSSQISESPILSPISPVIAIGLPLAEIIAAIMLLMPQWRLIGFYSSFLLMVVFTLYIIGILLFSKELPCSCGGVLAQLSWPQHIIFNSICITLGGLGIVLEKKIRRIQNDKWNLADRQKSSIQYPPLDAGK